VELSYFLPAKENFALLSDFILDFNMTDVIEYGAPLKYVTIDCLASDLRKEYFQRKSSELYLSASLAPKSESDWEFTDYAARKLLVINGGRQKGRILEYTSLQVFSTTSLVVPQYKNLRQRIVKICSKRGVRYLSGRIDKKMYFDPSNTSYEYRTVLDDPASVAVPVQ
jgi:hypothetical protein